MRSNVKQEVIVRKDVAERMFHRFISRRKGSEVTSREDADHAGLLSEEILHAKKCQGLTGCHDFGFLEELCNAVYRKFENSLKSQARTVTPDLYSLWTLASGITAELFADAFNESGVMREYCSSDKADIAFGSIGCWKDEEEIVGAGGNPPFDKTFIDNMVQDFDKGARGTSPYCHCVLLPLGSTYGLIEKTNSLSSKGVMLVRIPPGCLSFRRQECYFSYTSPAHPHQFQELGLFIWQNREYLNKNPPPQDVEVLYFHWIARACLKPAQVVMYLGTFAEAFPFSLRKREPVYWTRSK